MTGKYRERLTWGVLLFMSLVGILATIGHYAFQPPLAEAIAEGYGPSPAWYRDQLPRYAEHSAITSWHLLPGLLFMLLAPLQLSSRVRRRHPAVHRFAGRVMVGLSILVAVFGVILGFAMPFDGRLESWGSLLIASGLVVTLLLGVRAIRRGRIARHRFWMSYMLAFGYAPITMRFVLVLLVEVFGLGGQVVFAESMLAGTLINLLIVHTWLRHKPLPKADAGTGTPATTAALSLTLR